MADNETKKTQEETRSFLKDLKDKLSKNTNKEIEDNQKKTIDKMDVFYNTVTAKLTTLNKEVTKESTLDQMLPFVIQIADNIYNIAAKMDAQVTSLKEVTKVLDAKAMGPQKPDEGAELEKQRESAGRKGMEQKEKKVESFWDKLGKFFEFVLIPIVAGFVIGLSKSLGLFESGIGKFITLFGVLYLAFSGFRKAVNSLVINLAKKGLDLIRGRSATKAAGTVADAATSKGIPGKPGTVEGPVVKQPKGPSGLDKFLENAKKIGKSLKDLFVGIADTIAKVLGKLAGGIKEFISKVSEGIKNLLQNIAKGIESFGKGNVLKGAAALLVVSGALFVAAKAFKEFADVKWESVAKGLVGITGLVVVMKLLEKVTGSIIKGAAALAIMSGALFVAGKAFQQFADVKWEMLAIAAVGIGGLAAALMLLGPAIVPITLGAAALGIMSLALAGFGAAVQVLAVGLPTLSEFLQKISVIDGVGLISAAAGITAIGVALAALGAGQVVQAIGNFVSSVLSFGEDDIFTKLTRLGEVAGNLKELPSVMQQLGQLADFEVSDKFEEGTDKLAKGIVKLAIAAKLAKGLGLNLPIATESFVKAPGQVATQPAKTQPAKVQAKPQTYSKEDIAAAERNLAAAEKSGNKSAISMSRSRLSAMKQQNKLSETPAPVQGEKIKPVPTGVPGQTLNAESQKVAGTGGGAGGSSQNVVAPVTTTNVNQSQTQNLSVKPSATPSFGMWQSSFYNMGLAGQRPVF